jgi:predicted transposase/invertase (TIGR01784 family)
VKTDFLFYDLFQSSPEVVLELLGTPSPQRGLYSFVSQEVKETRFQIDGILLPHHRRPDLPIYFLEVQGYPQKKGDSFYHAFFAEINLYLNDYRPPNDWRGVILFTERRFDPGLPQHYQDYANSERLQRLYLDRMPEDAEGRSLAAGVIQLIGVKAKGAPERARRLIERARTEVTDAIAQREIIELIYTVFVYKFPKLSREEIETMLGLSELRQTKVYQEAVEEGEQRGELKAKLEMVPVLLELGMTVEQIAARLDLEVSIVKRATP